MAELRFKLRENTQIKEHKLQTTWLSRDQSIYLVLRAAIELNH